MDISRSADEDLVKRARHGSKNALEELFRRHWPAAWRRAFAVTGRRAVADDVAQDALVRAFAKLGDLEDGRRFGAWLAQIVTRRAIDVLRAEQRMMPLDPESAAGVEWVERAEEGGDIQQAIAGLSLERRTVVVLRYWLDLTPPEIAETLELPVGTVNSRLARGLADLRACLAEGPRA